MHVKMKIIRNIIAIVVAIFVFVCCAKKAVEKENVDFSFDKMSEGSVSDIVKSYKIVPLETLDEAYITRSSQVVVNGDKLFILEDIAGRKSQIYMFSNEGKYIGKINKQGRGPLEYQSISSFDINPNNGNIAILDSWLKKIKEYSAAGEQKKEIQLDCWAKEFRYFNTGANTFIVVTTKASRMANEEGRELYVYDQNDHYVYSSLPFDDPISMTTGNDISFSGSIDEISYLRPNTNQVYSVSKDSVGIKYLLNFPYPVLPGDEVENAFFKGKKILDKHVYNVIYFESSDLVYSQFMHDKKVYWGLYNKRSKKSTLFEEPKDPSCNCGLTLNVVGAFQDFFIIETDYSKINSVLKILDPGKGKCSNPKVFDAVDKLDMTSNPILLFVEFKF